MTRKPDEVIEDHLTIVEIWRISPTQRVVLSTFQVSSYSAHRTPTTVQLFKLTDGIFGADGPITVVRSWNHWEAPNPAERMREAHERLPQLTHEAGELVAAIS